MTSDRERLGRRLPWRAALRWCAGVLVLVLSVSGCSRPRPQAPAFRPGPLAWGTCDGKQSFDDELVFGSQEDRQDFHQRFTVSRGVVEVPVDYDRPEGEKIALTLVRARSKKAHDSLGPLLLSPGGPGASGLSTALRVARSAAERVSERFDFIGFDQRGIGCSDQVDCWAKDAQRRVDDPPDLRIPGAAEEAMAEYRTINQRCAERVGPKLAHYSTYEAARDMESIRVALGADRITYLGYSYGTFLGAVYAHVYPRSLRAAVLDSPTDNTHPATQRWEDSVRGWEEGLSEFLDWAASRPDLGLPPDARERLVGLAEQGDNVGLRVPDFFGKLGSYPNWPQLAKDLGDFLSSAAGPPNAPGGASWSAPDDFWESNHVIDCDDIAPGARADGQTVARFAEEWPRRYPMLGSDSLNWPNTTLLGCVGLPDPAHPAAPDMMDATGSPPILVVSGMHDVLTPHRLAEPFVAALRTGVLLSTQRPGHGQYLHQEKADGCLNTAVDDYLLDGALPARGAVCPLDG